MCVGKWLQTAFHVGPSPRTVNRASDQSPSPVVLNGRTISPVATETHLLFTKVYGESIWMSVQSNAPSSLFGSPCCRPCSIMTDSLRAFSERTLSCRCISPGEITFDVYDIHFYFRLEEQFFSLLAMSVFLVRLYRHILYFFSTL